MSNEARHRDIAALLARGVIRVKKQPTFAKTDKSTTPSEQTSSWTQQPRPPVFYPVGTCFPGQQREQGAQWKSPAG